MSLTYPDAQHGWYVPPVRDELDYLKRYPPCGDLGFVHRKHCKQCKLLSKYEAG
jgi:hypothetical protein